MINQLVKILSSDDGEIRDNPKWCLMDPCNPCGPATLCEGEFFGEGESGCEYETKDVIRGGITCNLCIEILKKYKAVKL